MMNFDNFVSEIEKNNWDVHGVEVYKNEDLLHSYGDTCDNSYDIYSATKTIVSIAMGIAYDQGLINLNDSVLKYIPQKNLQKMSMRQKDAFGEITIARLLTMSVEGLPFRPEGNSYLDYSLSCTITNPQKAVFNYSNVSAYLAGVALTEAFSYDLGRIIEEKILKPLEISKYEYGRCPEGYFYGASQMKMTVHDLSKIGMLLCNKGMFMGKQIVSEEYVNMAISVQQKNKDDGYGYFIWKYGDGFSINGKWGQRCICMPQRGIMVTYLSHMEENHESMLDSVNRNLLGNLGE